VNAPEADRFMVLAEEDPFVPLKPEGSKAYPRGDGFDVRVLAWNVVSIKKFTH
jgi:hypothetical protein